MRHNESAEYQPTVLMLADGLTILVALWGGMTSLLSAYGREEWVPSLVWACPVGVALVLAIWSRKRYSYAIAAATAVLTGAVAWSSWGRLRPAFHLLLNGAADTLGIKEPFSASYVSESARNLLLLFFVLLFALLLGWAVMRTRRWYLVLGLTFLPVAPAVMVGIQPDWWGLIAQLAAALAMLLTDFCRPSVPEVLGRSRLLSLGAAALLLIGMTWAIPREDNNRPQWAYDMKIWLEEMAAPKSDAALDGEPSENGATAAEGNAQATDTGVPGSVFVNGTVDLLSAGPRYFLGNTVLQVQGQEQGKVYLRGSSVTSYDGGSWKSLGEEAVQQLRDAQLAQGLDRGWEMVWSSWGDPLLYPSQTAKEQETRTMIIRHMDVVSGTVYTPYQLMDISTEGVFPVEDSGAVREGGIRAYETTYRAGGLEQGVRPLTRQTALAEEIYREFVKEHYLAVPSETAALLEPLLGQLEEPDEEQTSALPEEYRWAVNRARQVAVILENLAVYDPETPAMDPNGDFVEHFLTQGRGYCVHFATTAALMLRLEGIPARYVSGYMAILDRSGRSNVPDSNAHAWVEIYLDGYGWYPVEVTPGFSDGEEALRDEPLPAEDEQETPTSPEEEQLPEEDLSGAEGAGNSGWRDLGIVLLVAAILVGPRLMALVLRRRASVSRNINRSVIRAYRYYRRLLPWGGDEEQVLEELGRKVAFSGQILTEEERRRAWICAWRAVRKTGNRLNEWQRFAFRWLWLLE